MPQKLSPQCLKYNYLTPKSYEAFPYITDYPVE